MRLVHVIVFDVDAVPHVYVAFIVLSTVVSIVEVVDIIKPLLYPALTVVASFINVAPCPITVPVEPIDLILNSNQKSKCAVPDIVGKVVVLVTNVTEPTFKFNVVLGVPVSAIIPDALTLNVSSRFIVFAGIVTVDANKEVSVVVFATVTFDNCLYIIPLLSIDPA